MASRRLGDGGGGGHILDPACVWFGRSRKLRSALAGLVGLRTTTNPHNGGRYSVGKQCPMRIKVSMLNAIHVLLGVPPDELVVKRASNEGGWNRNT